MAVGPSSAASAIKRSSWRASAGPPPGETSLKNMRLSGPGSNAQRKEFFVAHEQIADGVDESGDDSQRSKEIKQNQEDNAPADLAQVEAVCSQPPQEDGQHDCHLAAVGKLLQFVALALDDPPTDGHRQQQGHDHLADMDVDIALDGVIDVREIVDHQSGDMRDPGKGLIGDRFAKGQCNKNNDEYGQGQYDFLQHGGGGTSWRGKGLVYPVLPRVRRHNEVTSSRRAACSGSDSSAALGCFGRACSLSTTRRPAAAMASVKKSALRKPKCSARSDMINQPSPCGVRCADSPFRKASSMRLSGS